MKGLCLPIFLLFLLNNFFQGNAFKKLINAKQNIENMKPPLLLLGKNIEIIHNEIHIIEPEKSKQDQRIKQKAFADEMEKRKQLQQQITEKMKEVKLKLNILKNRNEACSKEITSKNTNISSLKKFPSLDNIIEKAKIEIKKIEKKCPCECKKNILNNNKEKIVICRKEKIKCICPCGEGYPSYQFLKNELIKNQRQNITRSNSLFNPYLQIDLLNKSKTVEVTKSTSQNSFNKSLKKQKNFKSNSDLPLLNIKTDILAPVGKKPNCNNKMGTIITKVEGEVLDMLNKIKSNDEQFNDQKSGEKENTIGQILNSSLNFFKNNNK
jgi:hypothetical protein